MSTNYAYRGAYALIELHDVHLREFVETWRQAKMADITLPQTDDPNYRSMETLLSHVFRAARGYMTWACEKLELPDPEIRKTPEADELEVALEDYMEHLLERYRLPLADVPPDKFHRPSYESRWKVEYSIDAMLEHAAMHPLRHRYQLEALLGG